MTQACSLLLVEDDTDLLEILTRAFNRRGFSVIATVSTEEALQFIRQHSFEVAVIDGNLRGQDGIALLQQLKSVQPELRIVVLSGCAEQAVRDYALSSGASAYLCKPCSLANLQATIESVLEDTCLSTTNST